ncbi:MAG: DUF2752 domain-containing protein [Anaeroplasmataceae bacterium]
MIKDYVKIFFNFLKKSWIPLVILLVYIITTHLLFETSCPIKLITGLPCPGCGMTRAFISLLKLDIIKAFNYHALFIIVPFIIFIFIFQERPIINKLFNSKILWSVVIALFIGYFIYRIIYVRPDVPMDFYKDSLINKLFKFIK